MNIKAVCICYFHCFFIETQVTFGVATLEVSLLSEGHYIWDLLTTIKFYRYFFRVTTFGGRSFQNLKVYMCNVHHSEFRVSKKDTNYRVLHCPLKLRSTVVLWECLPIQEFAKQKSLIQRKLKFSALTNSKISLANNNNSALSEVVQKTDYDYQQNQAILINGRENSKKASRSKSIH